MGKSFKQLPSPQRSASATPLSELDFFALRENPGAADNSGLLVTTGPALLPDPAQENQAGGNTGNSVSTCNPVNPDKLDKRMFTGNKTLKKEASVASNISNTDNRVNSGKGDKPGNSRNPAVLIAPPASRPATDEGGVRQTFVLGRGHLEQLRDYVHARRAGGDYSYSQKQALQEALDMLFTTAGPANPRPSQAREREEQHRERIRQGRQARTAKD